MHPLLMSLWELDEKQLILLFPIILLGVPIYIVVKYLYERWRELKSF